MPVSTLSCEDAISFCVDAVWALGEKDVEGRYIWVNPAYCTILNAPADLIIGTSYKKWTSPEDVSIEESLMTKVRTGELPGYTLSKRYIQRGSTPQAPREIWGLLSVSGKWSATGEFLGYRVQYRPYDPHQQQMHTMLPQVDLKKAFQWTVTNWKTVATVLAVLTSLIFGGSETLLNALRKAQDTKESVDSVLQPSSSGASSVPRTP